MPSLAVATCVGTSIVAVDAMAAMACQATVVESASALRVAATTEATLTPTTLAAEGVTLAEIAASLAVTLTATTLTGYAVVPIEAEASIPLGIQIDAAGTIAVQATVDTGPSDAAAVAEAELLISAALTTTLLDANLVATASFIGFFPIDIDQLVTTVDYAEPNRSVSTSDIAYAVGTDESVYAESY
jgi:hypothetical protein